jgi:hypothetical protein
MMAFRGVRSSWLMRARNLDFCALASSRAARACSASALASCSPHVSLRDRSTRRCHCKAVVTASPTVIIQRATGS